MTTPNFRIHPAIGIARVGNSQAEDGYYIGPETIAGDGANGGLPIRAGTEDTPITSSDLRDSDGAFKRQAARFKIYQYPAQDGPETYPLGLPSDEVEEIRIGSKVGDKTVADIIWTVHVANKKANAFVLVESVDASVGQYEGICGYDDGNLPPVRNWGAKGQPEDKMRVLNEPDRVRALTIDPGPRTIHGTDAAPVHFDQATEATWCSDSGHILELDNYAKSFPSDSFSNLECPSGPIDTLGELRTDASGRLLVLGGYGRAISWGPQAEPPAPHIPNEIPNLDEDVNNDQWFDDASDGPVTAVLVFDDGSAQAVEGNAWVVTTDPSYAPQILNAVSLFDDIYDSWVRKLNLAPQLHAPDGGDGCLICKDGVEQLPETWFTDFNRNYEPSFDAEIQPIFRSVALQRWTINLNSNPGVSGHEAVGKITADTNPNSTPLQGLAFIRVPGNASQQTWSSDSPLMPAALGDANQNLLTLTQTQYFLLYQWANPPQDGTPDTTPALGPGEHLDKAVLMNCLGGRFSPGIDLTFLVRQPDLYVKDWQNSGQGPFRVKIAPLEYGNNPVLGEGYVPLNTGNEGAEPGDLSKMMAIPWHTDYNSCATHQTSEGPYLFWSWPAQRPVAVFVADEVAKNGGLMADGLPLQQWSVRGEGTSNMDSPAQDWGRYQDGCVHLMLTNWHKIGVVMNAGAIDTASDGAPLPESLAGTYLEAQSQLQKTEDGNPVVQFPNFVDQTPKDS